MPTYDYHCEKCGHEFEFFQSMKDDRLTDCPQEPCDGTVKRRIGTGAGIIFKGSGFYETDYRSDSYKKAAKADSGSSDSGSSDAGGGGSDSGSGKSSADGGSKKSESKPTGSSGGDSGSKPAAASKPAPASGD